MRRDEPDEVGTLDSHVAGSVGEMTIDGRGQRRRGATIPGAGDYGQTNEHAGNL